MILILGLMLIFSFANAKHEMYDGHSLFEVKIQNVEQYKFVDAMQGPLQLDIWSYVATEKQAVILVPKQSIERFQYELHSNKIQFRMQVENIKGLLEEEDKLMEEASQKSLTRSDDNLIDYGRVYNLSEVYTFIDHVAETYPEVVTLVNAGKSIEGRDVKYLKISTTNFEDTSKPIIFVESLLHAREWITLPVTLYAIEQLVVNNTDSDLLNTIDWIIMPIANPDGYEYSHTDQRLWRKNRARGFLPGDTCMGVDLNRNFDIFYGTISSYDVCSNNFHGRGPFSEPESRIVRDIFHQYGSRIEQFNDIHSTGSMIMYGWGTGVLAPNALMTHVAAIHMIEAINAVKIYWTPYYIVGNIADVMFLASGTAMDYATKTGVPYSYIYELPAHRYYTGEYRFLVDPAFLYQAAMETWQGIKVGARFVRDRRANQSTNFYRS